MKEQGNSARRRNQAILTYGLLSVVLLVVLFPIYWMVITALKTESEITRRIPTFFPEHPTLANAIDLFVRSPVPQQMTNSMLIASCVTTATFARSAGRALRWDAVSSANSYAARDHLTSGGTRNASCSPGRRPS